MPPTAVPKTSKRQRKAQERIRKQAKPVYMLSDDDVDKWGFTEILLHCNDFGFLSKPSACLPWKRMHSWIILHNNSLMLTPQVSLSKWLNHFNWGCNWHTGSGNVILQNSSCHNVSLISIFKSIGPLRVLLSDLLLLLYRRRIFSLLFILWNTWRKRIQNHFFMMSWSIPSVSERFFIVQHIKFLPLMTGIQLSFSWLPHTVQVSILML